MDSTQPLSSGDLLNWESVVQSEELPGWADLGAGGAVCSLSHLRPFTVNVTPKLMGAPTFKVYVSFGCHTVSKTWSEICPTSGKMVCDSEVRCFCPIRYGHSLSLPNIIHEGVTGRAFFGQTRNYLIVKNLSGAVGPYVVFFNLQRAKSKSFDVAMFVVSAYEKPELPQSLPTITFATLVAKTARGEPVIRPKK